MKLRLLCHSNKGNPPTKIAHDTAVSESMAVCTENPILIAGVSESPRFEGDARGDLDRSGCPGSAVQVEGPA
jgi:hypothetical protein